MKTYVTCCRLRRTFANEAMLSTVSLAVLSVVMFGGQAVYAQQVIADGTTQTASGAIDTGTSSGNAGYALHALNNGLINSSSSLTLITGGVGAYGVYAESGGQITIVGGSTLTTTGQGGYGLFAIGNGGTISTIIATDTAISTTAGNTLAVIANGGVVNLTGGSVTTSGSEAYGVLANNGGQVTIVGGSIATTGWNALGLWAGTGSGTITATDLAISTVADYAYGVVADGVINLTGGSITTSGEGASGAWALTGTVNMTGGSVTTSGDDGYGLNSDIDGVLNAEGTIVQTSGASATGAFAIEGQMVLNNVLITTTGDSAEGAVVEGPDQFSQLTITGGSVTTSGASATGLRSTEGSLLTAEAVVISTTGDDSAGALAQDGAELHLNGATVTTVGTESAGLFSVGLQGTIGASLTAGGVAVTTFGANSYGAAVRGGSSLVIADGSSITTTGPGSAALFSSADDINPSTATITNSTLISEQDVGILTDGTTLNASFSGSSLTGGAALMQTINGGILNLMADSSTLSGAALTEASSGSVSNVTLLNNTLWTMTGNSNVSSLTNNASTISFSAPTGDPVLLSSYKTLTTSDYAGQGGTIVFNTVLGGDGSPTDQLHVTGTTAGDTFVRVTNAGGPGAETVEGIRLIEVGGTSDGRFSLLGDYVTKDSKQAVVGGAYAYTLEKNGISTPSDGDWYLRSQIVDPVISEGRRYAPSVPVYEAYPQALQALNGLPTLQQRVGNRFWAGAQRVDGAGPAGDGAGIWGRIEGVHTRFSPASSTSAADYDIDTFKLQVGIDGLMHEDEPGSLIGGITLNYGHGAANVSSFFGDGRISTDGYGIGGTLTWYGDNGFYVDGQAQTTWYRSDLTSRARNMVTPQLADANDGFGYAVSVEVGKSMELANNWSMTPQAQLIYSAVDFDGFTDPFGAQVLLDRGDSLRSRLGLAFDYDRTWRTGNGRISRSHVYGIANLFYEFLDGTKVDVSDTDFINKNDRLWGDSGLVRPITGTTINTHYTASFPSIPT